jgi:hypothetical protein
MSQRAGKYGEVVNEGKILFLCWRGSCRGRGSSRVFRQGKEASFTPRIRHSSKLFTLGGNFFNADRASVIPPVATNIGKHRSDLVVL